VRADVADPKALRDVADQLRDKLRSGVVVLAGVEGDKVALVSMVTPDLTSRYNAGKIVGEVAKHLGGKGGGRADMAQGGGSHPSCSIRRWPACSSSSVGRVLATPKAPTQKAADADARPRWEPTRAAGMDSTLDGADDASTLAAALRRRLPGRSWSDARRLCESGKVRLTARPRATRPCACAPARRWRLT